jgi:hypothetical protein
MKRKLGVLVLFVCVLVAAQHRTRASSLELLVTEGGTTVTIADNGPLDTDPTPGSIQVDTLALNAFLLASGASYQFNTLGATSNSPGSPSLGSLSQTGEVQLLPGRTGSIQVLASDHNYTLPSGTSDALLGSTSSTFTTAPGGDSQAFTSYYNPSNTLAAKEVADPTITLASTGTSPNSEGASSAAVTVTGVIPYGVSDLADITLSGGAPGAPSQLQFAGTTEITSAPVPLPTSVVGGMALFGLVAGLDWFRRLARQNAARLGWR